MPQPLSRLLNLTEQPDDTEITSNSTSTGGNLKPREANSLAGGHTARHGRTKVQTQGPICCLCHLG